MTELRRTFDDVVDEYDAIRPGYPDALFDVVFDRLPTRPHIVEVGPGTGQATRSLLARGAHVHGVELGPALADRLLANLGGDRLDVTVGDFEVVDLGRSWADAVVSATAYHWIRPPARLDRPAAVLRSGGVLAVVDLVQVDDPHRDGGFFEAVQPIYERHGEALIGYEPPTRDAVAPIICDELDDDHRFDDVRLHRFDWDQTYTAAEYRTLMTSYSGTQAMPADARRALLDGVEGFVEREWGGRVTRPLVAALTTAERR